MKKLIALLLVLTLVLSLAACSGGEPGKTENTEKPGATENTRTDITIANATPIPDFNPVEWYMSDQSNLFQNVFSTLVDTVIHDDLSVEYRPNLAKSWEAENDGKVWVFHLNEKAVFANGDPVTADDVKRCFEYHRDSPYTMFNVTMIESIDVRDEHTVAFNLTGPNASVPGCWYMIAIFDADLYEANKDTFFDAPNGSGPYTVTKMDKTTGDYTLTLKENWWGETKPTIQTINIKTITDKSTLVIALQKGEVDVANLAGTNFALVEKDDKIDKRETVSLVGYQVLMSQNNEILKEHKELRQAIAYAIDYDAIRMVTTGGYVASKESTVRFATLDAELPAGVEKYSYNVEKAKELIASTGLETPIDLGELIGGSNGAAEMVQQYLAEVGIKVTPQSYENNEFMRKMMGGEYGIGITTGSGYVSAAETMLNYYGSGMTYNFSKYSNAEVDALIATMMSTQDKTEYLNCLKEALTIVVEDCPAVDIGLPAQYVCTTKGLYVAPVWNGVDMIVAHW